MTGVTAFQVSRLRIAVSPQRWMSALLRLLMVPLITVGVHSVTRFSAWLLLPLCIIAAALVAATDLAIPGLGTFKSRVLIYDGKYAGTWQHGKIGGSLFGRIERIEKAETEHTNPKR